MLLRICVKLSVTASLLQMNVKTSSVKLHLQHCADVLCTKNKARMLSKIIQ